MWGGAGVVALALAALPAAVGAEAGAEALPTLWQRTVAADVVAVARIVHPSWEIPVGEPPVAWPVVEAQASEILKGELAPGRLTFARDGVEMPPYAFDQEVIVFLHAIARSPKLGESAVAGTVRWTSPPDPVENVVLTARGRDAYLQAVRGYTTIAAMAPSPAQTERLRTLTIDLLASPEPGLARSAIRDLALAGNVPLLTRSDAGRVGRLVYDRSLPIATRVALLGELERRGLIFGPTAWARLLRETRGAERLAAVRACEGNQSTAVVQALTPMLGGADPALAVAAATALGSVGNHRAVEPLVRALASPDPRVRLAIVRALATIRTQAARQALDLAAEGHPDPATRRAALAEVVMLARRHGTTLAPMNAPPGAGARADAPTVRVAAGSDGGTAP